MSSFNMSGYIGTCEDPISFQILVNQDNFKIILLGFTEHDWTWTSCIWRTWNMQWNQEPHHNVDVTSKINFYVIHTFMEFI